MNGLAMYAATQQHTHKDRVEKHASLVKRIACHLINRLPASVQLEDLVQAGMIGLLEASRNYDERQAPVSKPMPGFVFVAPCWMRSARMTGRQGRCIARRGWSPKQYARSRMRWDVMHGIPKSLIHWKCHYRTIIKSCKTTVITRF